MRLNFFIVNFLIIFIVLLLRFYEPVWVISFYLVFVLFLSFLIWGSGNDRLAFVLVRVVVGRLAVYFLISVFTYFKMPRRLENRNFLRNRLFFVSSEEIMVIFFCFCFVFCVCLYNVIAGGLVFYIFDILMTTNLFFFELFSNTVLLDLDYLSSIFFLHGGIRVLVLRIMVNVLVGLTINFSNIYFSRFNEKQIYLL